MKYFAFFIILCVALFSRSIQSEQSVIHSQVEIREATTSPNESHIHFHIQAGDETTAGGEIVHSSGQMTDRSHTYTLLESTPITTHVNILATLGEEVDISCTHKGKLASEQDSNQTIDLTETGFQVGQDPAMIACTQGIYPIQSQGNNLIYIETALPFPHDFTVRQSSYSTSHAGGQPISFTITYK